MYHVLRVARDFPAGAYRPVRANYLLAQTVWGVSCSLPSMDGRAAGTLDTDVALTAQTIKSVWIKCVVCMCINHYIICTGSTCHSHVVLCIAKLF